MKPYPEGFHSPLASKMEDYLELNRATGRKYRAVEDELRRVDRFVDNWAPPSETITLELAHAWLSAKPYLHPATQHSRESIFRLFCVYLNRLNSKSYVPERIRLRIPVRKPHVYSVEEIRLLLEGSLNLSTRGWWFRPRSVYSLLCCLYGTGLRIGEACKLSIGDVDFMQRTLLVRDAKFFKDRIVPFSQSLGRELETYFEVRKTIAPADATAPFFLNRRLAPISPVKTSWFFHRFLRQLGIQGRAGGREPRLHDLRRTFAVHRLLRWYKEGADLWAKLPLLSTYMGHSSVLATHVYLTATPELLREASGRFERKYGALLSDEEA